ncbi:hypothetical protein [Xenorhabdus lircayensis]|uniref:Uncharacterized protein n=1 Tax=Xenorhabdus lircayensis TaxID=2763499 RepID=A0ABS0U333_9GAMM|nr:hypothetical protein [Xenorhabdus lircayensis]MBI6548291.1 hypothetical protein [Xenorhabdus lircayensis]
MKKIIAMCLAATIIGGFSVNTANAENTTPMTTTNVKSNPTNDSGFLHELCLKLIPEKYKILCELI